MSEELDTRTEDSLQTHSDRALHTSSILLPRGRSLEQDADKVIFIYRPDYYKFSEDVEGNSDMNVVEILIAKNKSGTLQNIALESINALK